MKRRTGGLPIAAMFVVFAAAFSVIFWPDVPVASKLAFFAAGAGFGVGIAQLKNRASEPAKSMDSEERRSP